MYTKLQYFITLICFGKTVPSSGKSETVHMCHLQVYLNSALFWDVRHRRLVLYQRFGLRIGPIFNGQDVEGRKF